MKSLNIAGLSIVFGLMSLSNGAHADALKVRGMAASCSACHGTNGAAQAGMVALAGQPKATLIKSMQDFKSGARPATIMHQLAKGYSDPQIEELAGYFAAQKQ